MSADSTFHNADPESQEAQSAYHELLGSIERHMNPTSNTVLVVDDMRLVRKMVARNISENDPNVIVFEAEDGQQALQRLAEIREKYTRDPLFIITDLEMPVMDGWTLIEHLRKDYEGRGQTQGIPLIVLSSSTGEKGSLFFKRSVHGDKCAYSPMVTIAKDDCVKPDKYATKGEKGLRAWARHFLRYARPAPKE